MAGKGAHKRRKYDVLCRTFGRSMEVIDHAIAWIMSKEDPSPPLTKVSAYICTQFLGNGLVIYPVSGAETANNGRRF